MPRSRIVTVTIDEQGDLLFLGGANTRVFTSIGSTTTRRASHVEPSSRLLRYAFHILRTLCFDDSAAAEWTRSWPCLWRVNTAPVGGPVLEGRWRDRDEAITVEIDFLNRLFAR